MKNVRMMVLLTCFLLNQSLVHPCGFTLEGDLNGDCTVNLEDLAKIAFNWLVDCSENPQHSSCIPLSLSSGDIVICEAMIMPSAVSESYGEWFEIYNTKNFPLSLEGLVITNGSSSHTISGSLIIDAYGRLVFGINGNTELNGGVTADYVYSGISLNNPDGSIAIVSGSTVIDEVVYVSGSWPVVSGASMSLDPSSHNAASNDLAYNWCTAQSLYNAVDLGTPGLANDDCPPYVILHGDLVISEAMINPEIAFDTNGEWFEIYNTKDFPVNLEGMIIGDTGTDSFTISGPLYIEPHGRIVFGRNANLADNGGVTVDYVYTGFTLTNSDDTIVMTTGDGNVIDTVAYESGTWPVVSGASMSLDPSAHDPISNDFASNWCQGQSLYGAGDHGTPGNVNDNCF